MATKNIDESWYINFFVDHYMNMINEQRKDCHCFSVDFLLKFHTGGLDVVKRNIKQTVNNPLLSYHTLIFSILKNNYWTIAVVDTEKYRIMYYDRFGRDDETITSSITKFLQQWQELRGIAIYLPVEKKKCLFTYTNNFFRLWPMDCTNGQVLSTTSATCIQIRHDAIHSVNSEERTTK